MYFYYATNTVDKITSDNNEHAYVFNYTFLVVQIVDSSEVETKETIFQDTKLPQSKTRTFQLSSTTLSLELAQVEEAVNMGNKQRESGELSIHTKHE